MKPCADVQRTHRLDSLEYFIYEKTGVPADAVWAYLSDGRPLKNDNVRELAGLEDQVRLAVHAFRVQVLRETKTIYVFNKTYLSSDPDEVIHHLHCDPELQPPVEGEQCPVYIHFSMHTHVYPRFTDAIASTPPFRISQLASSYVQTALAHVEYINRTLTSLHYQQRAILISSSALDHHILATSDTYEGVAAIAERELDKQATLLAGLDADLEIVSRVKVHKDFLSVSVRRAMEAGDKGRTLGDYVSKVKMQQVAASCVKTHEELRTRFDGVREAMERLSRGSDEVRHAVSNNRCVSSL